MQEKSKSSPKNKWDKNNKTIVVLLIVIIIIFMNLAIGINKSDTTTPTDATSTQEQQVPKTNQEEKVSIANKVESKYLEFWGVKDLSELHSLEGVSLNLRSITGFEEVNSGVVRVYVQEDISKAEAEEVGRHIMGAVGMDIPELDFVVPRGTNGLDVNVSRSDIPALR